MQGQEEMRSQQIKASARIVAEQLSENPMLGIAREKELAAQHEEVAIKAQRYFAERHLAPSDHAYLVNKGISPDGLKVTPTGTELIVPLINTEGEIRTLQYINEDGGKRFEPGGEKKGNFNLIGADISKDEKSLAQGEIILAEGRATGASLNAATGKPVAVAFDSGNLEAVARKIREKFPRAQITICADNDYSHTRSNGEPYNVGVEKAKQAAQAVGGKVVVPIFNEEEKHQRLKDFNDLHASRGLAEVKRQFGLSRNREADRSKGRGLEVAL